MQLLPTRPAGDDQASVLEDPQMLHDTESRHIYFRLELGDRGVRRNRWDVEERGGACGLWAPQRLYSKLPVSCGRGSQ